MDHKVPYGEVVQVNSWTRWVLRHRAAVVLAWVAVAVAGAVLAPRTVGALSYEFALPGQPAYEANQRITAATGGGGANDPLVLVGEAPTGTVNAGSFSAVGDAVAQAVPGTRVVAPDDAAAHLVGAEGQVAAVLLYPPVVPGETPYAAALAPLQAAAAEASSADLRLSVTGTSLLLESSDEEDRGVLVEVLLGGLGALIVLALVFGSLLAAVPLVVAAVSILATFLVLLGLTTVTDVVFVVQYLVALIGLGVAIDYSLLIVMRWREERAGGLDGRAAVQVAMATAGRAVVLSGVTVAVSLAALIAVPLPFLRSIGLGGLLIPLLSVLTATTLLPVLLDVFGTRLQWPRRASTDPTSPGWRRIALVAVRRPVVVALASTAVLLALAAPLLGLRLGSPQLSSYDTATTAGAAASTALGAGIPPGALRPIEVLVPDPGGAETARQELEELPGIAAAVAPTRSGWQIDDGQLLQVWTADDATSDSGTAAVAAVRDAADGGGAGLGGALVGGSAAEEADFVSAVYSDAPFAILAVIVVTFLLLARSLRSLWLPIKALLLNIVSLAAAYGITVLIWQGGIGTEALFGTGASGAITVWVPIAAFAFLFGLSMDYEVFILSRMREAYDEHGDTDRAVVDGIASTGRLVTSAALILFLSFVALSTVPSVEVKILATALAFGIVIDAVIVRAFLAPALVALLGDRNWTIPSVLSRVLGLGRA